MTAYLQWPVLRNGMPLARREIPILGGDAFRHSILEAVADDGKVAAFFGHRTREQDGTGLYAVLAFRDADFTVRFSLVNAATARLLTLLQEDAGLTGAAALGRLETELALAAGALARHGGQILADLRRQGALLGTRT